MKSIKVFFIHGLEGSTKGRKGKYLTDRFTFYGFDMKIREKIQQLQKSKNINGKAKLSMKQKQKILLDAVKFQKDHIVKIGVENIDVFIGSSFGGGVLLHMMNDISLNIPNIKPVLLLAPSIYSRFPDFEISDRIKSFKNIKIVHGYEDNVIPLKSSKKIISFLNKEYSELIIVDDDHRLGTIVTHDNEGSLSDIIKKVVEV